MNPNGFTGMNSLAEESLEEADGEELSFAINTDKQSEQPSKLL